MPRKTPLQMLQMYQRNAMGNARYYRALRDFDYVRKHVRFARELNRQIRQFIQDEAKPHPQQKA